jgi:hypothetical protein
VSSRTPELAGASQRVIVRQVLCDPDLFNDEVESGHPFRAAASSTLASAPGGQLAAKCPAALHVQSLGDRLMADAHRSVVGEVGKQAIRDLFRAPCSRPPAGLPASMSTPLPLNLGPRDGSPAWCCEVAGHSILHVLQ